MNYIRQKMSALVFLGMALVSSLGAQEVRSRDGAAENVRQKKEHGRPAKGGFLTIMGENGTSYRVYAAGPQNASTGVLLVHDYFGLSPSAIESADRLGALGYRTVAVDLYKGRSATNNEDAAALMNTKDSSETKRIIRAALTYLSGSQKRLAAIGFSAGGIDAVRASIMASRIVGATVVVYGGGYDMLDAASLQDLKAPMLAITGSLDKWPLEAATNFLLHHSEKSLELYVYPGADHGYAQPLFNEGKNFNAEATRITWKLIADFLARHLASTR